MPECKFCKEPELEWFFEENTSKYKLGRKIDDNVFTPHKCKKIAKKQKKWEPKHYPYRYVSAMCMDICKKHNLELTELMRCKVCGLEKPCHYKTVIQKALKYPYRFRIVNGKEERDYDITLNDVIKDCLSLN